MNIESTGDIVQKTPCPAATLALILAVGVIAACSSSEADVVTDISSDQVLDGEADVSDSGDSFADHGPDTSADLPAIDQTTGSTDTPDTSADQVDTTDGDTVDDMTCVGDCTRPLPDCRLDDVERAPGANWGDSYSVDGNCYCASTFDHNVGDIVVDTPVGPRTVLEVCNAIGPGPGVGDNPVYNDIQCGNGPANDAGDEDWCPGRVDMGVDGCCTAGPPWNLDGADWQ